MSGLTKGHLLILVTFCLVAVMEQQRSPVERLVPLVHISARRLTIAELVALAKWDSHIAVEDKTRENQVIVTAITKGSSRGLDGTFLRNFFMAQIEANKLVQNSLLAEWYRAGKAPAHGPIDLGRAIRPQLDKLQTELIGELVETADIRGSTRCREYLARAISQYLAQLTPSATPLQAMALDRSLAATCTHE
jgi:chorismate mutase